MNCSRCGLEVLAGEATAMYGDTGTLHHPKTCIERLKQRVHDVQEAIGVDRRDHTCDGRVLEAWRNIRHHHAGFAGKASQEPDAHVSSNGGR